MAVRRSAAAQETQAGTPETVAPAGAVVPVLALVPGTSPAPAQVPATSPVVRAAPTTGLVTAGSSQAGYQSDVQLQTQALLEQVLAAQNNPQIFAELQASCDASGQPALSQASQRPANDLASQRIIFESFWDHFGIILGSLFGIFWDLFGIILGSFWDHFEEIL